MFIVANFDSHVIHFPFRMQVAEINVTGFRAAYIITTDTPTGGREALSRKMHAYSTSVMNAAATTFLFFLPLPPQFSPFFTIARFYFPRNARRSKVRLRDERRRFIP